MAIQDLLTAAPLTERISGTDSINVAFTINGFRYADVNPTAPYTAYESYPNGLKWPKSRLRRLWSWAFIPFFSLTWIPVPPAKDEERWGTGLKLPGLTRVGADLKAKGRGKFKVGNSTRVGRFTRQVVGVEEKLTHLWYYHYTRPRNILERAWHWLLYWSAYRWLSEYNFSAQDGSVMPSLVWNRPEMLSPTDFGVVQWRKLVAIKHFGGRDAKFNN